MPTSGSYLHSFQLPAKRTHIYSKLIFSISSAEGWICCWIDQEYGSGCGEGQLHQLGSPRSAGPWCCGSCSYSSRSVGRTAGTASVTWHKFSLASDSGSPVAKTLWDHLPFLYQALCLNQRIFRATECCSCFTQPVTILAWEHFCSEYSLISAVSYKKMGFFSSLGPILVLF